MVLVKDGGLVTTESGVTEGISSRSFSDLDVARDISAKHPSSIDNTVSVWQEALDYYTAPAKKLWDDLKRGYEDLSTTAQHLQQTIPKTEPSSPERTDWIQKIHAQMGKITGLFTQAAAQENLDDRYPFYYQAEEKVQEIHDLIDSWPSPERTHWHLQVQFVLAELYRNHERYYQESRALEELFEYRYYAYTGAELPLEEADKNILKQARYLLSLALYNQNLTRVGGDASAQQAAHRQVNKLCQEERNDSDLCLEAKALRINALVARQDATPEEISLAAEEARRLVNAYPEHPAAIRIKEKFFGNGPLDGQNDWLAAAKTLVAVASGSTQREGNIALEMLAGAAGAGIFLLTLARTRNEQFSTQIARTTIYSGAMGAWIGGSLVRGYHRSNVTALAHEGFDVVTSEQNRLNLARIASVPITLGALKLISGAVQGGARVLLGEEVTQTFVAQTALAPITGAGAAVASDLALGQISGMTEVHKEKAASFAFMGMLSPWLRRLPLWQRFLDNPQLVSGSLIALNEGKAIYDPVLRQEVIAMGSPVVEMGVQTGIAGTETLVFLGISTALESKIPTQGEAEKDLGTSTAELAATRLAYGLWNRALGGIANLWSPSRPFPPLSPPPSSLYPENPRLGPVPQKALNLGREGNLALSPWKRLAIGGTTLMGVYGISLPALASLSSAGAGQETGTWFPLALAGGLIIGLARPPLHSESGENFTTAQDVLEAQMGLAASNPVQQKYVALAKLEDPLQRLRQVQAVKHLLDEIIALQTEEAKLSPGQKQRHRYEILEDLLVSAEDPYPIPSLDHLIYHLRELKLGWQIGQEMEDFCLRNGFNSPQSEFSKRLFLQIDIDCIKEISELRLTLQIAEASFKDLELAAKKLGVQGRDLQIEKQKWLRYAAGDRSENFYLNPYWPSRIPVQNIHDFLTNLKNLRDAYNLQAELSLKDELVSFFIETHLALSIRHEEYAQFGEALTSMALACTVEVTRSRLEELSEKFEAVIEKQNGDTPVIYLNEGERRRQLARDLFFKHPHASFAEISRLLDEILITTEPMTNFP